MQVCAPSWFIPEAISNVTVNYMIFFFFLTSILFMFPSNLLWFNKCKIRTCDLRRQVADLSSKLREMRQYWIQLPVAICSKLAAGGANQDKCWNGITKARWGSRQAVQNSALTQSKLFNSFAFLSVSFRCGVEKEQRARQKLMVT